MKKTFLNITKAFLLGLAFVAVGCSDYDEDIKDLNNRIDAVTSQITGEIDLTKVDLDNTKKDLNSAKEALAALQVKHDEDIAALKASDATLKASIADANAAIVALKSELTDADAALNSKVDGVEAELNAKIAAEIATVNEKIAAAEAQIEGLKGNVSDLNTKDAELDKKIADLDEKMAALKNELNDLISKNADDIAGNAAAIKALQENMAEYVKAFGEYQTAVATQIAALEAKDAQIEKSIEGINESIAKIEASIEAMQSGKVNVTDFEAYKAEAATQFETLQNAIYDLEYADVKLNKKDKELSDRIYNLKTNLETRLDEAFGKIAANTTDIAALQAAVEKNKTDIAANATAIADVNADLIEAVETLNAKDAEISKNLNDAIAKAAEDLAAAVAKLDAKDAELGAADAALAKAIEDLGVKLSKDIETLKKDIEAKLTELAKKDAELAEQIAANATKIASIGQKVDELEKKHDEFVKAFTIWKGELHDRICAIEKKDAEQDGRLQLSEEAIKALQEKDAALDAAIADLQAQIDALGIDVNKLVNRVQSLVYVPEYSDGKATIKYALMSSVKGDNEANERKIIEAASTFQYQVYPAECAAQIATLFASNNGILAFDVKSVKDANTRSGEKATLAITNVEADEDGILTITANARNFAELFYTDGETEDGVKFNYSASLVLNYEGYDATEEIENGSAAANLSSCYTNLVPSANTTDYITVSLANVPAEGFDTLFIEYTKRNSEKALEFAEFEKDGKKEVLKGVSVVYTIGDDEYTYEEMVAAGYAVSVPSYSYAVKGYNHDVTVTVEEDDAANGKFKQASLLSFFDYDNIKDGEDLAVAPATREVATTIQPVVWLTADATASTVGSKLEYTGTYTVDGFELSASQFVVVDANVVAIEATVPDVVWNYADDAEADASRLDADATNDVPYRRENLELTFAEGALDQLDGIDINDLVTSGYTSLKGYNEAGLTKARIANGSADDQVVVAEFESFKWGETINIVYGYTKNKSVRVDLSVTIKTVDRARNVVVKIEKEKNVELKKNISFDELEAMSLESIYSTLNAAYDLSEMTQDDFLADVLVTNLPAEVKSLDATTIGNDAYAGAVKDATTITVDNADATANVSFSYNDFSFVPTKVVYKDVMTLWYGQEVTLEYTVNFEMPKAAYNFNHVDLWVKSGANGIYSDVQGNYSPNKESVALTSFSVSNIDMDKAFVVVDKDGKVVSNLEELGLVTEFVIEDDTTAADMKGIEFTDNVLAYNGKKDAVNVEGNLYLQHDNDAKIALETKFDTDEAYVNYVVNKFDPFTALEAEDITIDITEVQEYKLDVRSRFSIYESRDGSGNATKLGDGDGFTVDLLTDAGKYIVGNGTNGWASGKKIAGIYGGVYTPVMTFTVAESEIDDMYAHVIKYDEANRVLSFDNTPNLELDKPVTIKVVATIDYAWGYKEAALNVTFQPKK